MLAFPTLAAGAQALTSIRMISKNVRYATPWTVSGEKPWLTRRPLVCAELDFLSLSVDNTFICLQEVLHVQLVDIHACLGVDQWSYIGVGRTDGKKEGEYSPVFYRTDLWKLDSASYVWLSESPDRPSKSWGAGSIRILTIGDFTHKSSGKKVTVMSTHLDDRSALARLEAAKIILKVISNHALESENQPVFLAGDFNSEPTDDAYQTMVALDSGMLDARESVSTQMRYGHYHTYSSFQVDSKSDPPLLIDFVFYNKKSNVKARTYAVMENKYDDEVYNSDHRAVVVDFSL